VAEARCLQAHPVTVMVEEKVIVRLDGVDVSFGGSQVLEGVTIDIHENDYIAVLGPNGGGKSTLLKVILGLIPPDAGTVEVFGTSPEEGRRRIGYLPQYARFDREFPITVNEVVLMGRYRGPFSGYTTMDRQKVTKALDTVEMSEYGDRQIGALSGGQLQRVLLARALAREPELLLLDEPMASIDPDMQRSFYELMAELRDRMAVVMVTHDIGVMSEEVVEVACLNRKLFHHGDAEGGAEGLEAAYACPIQLIDHGHPHRVLRRH